MKMAQCEEIMSVQNEHYAVNEFLTAENISPIDIHWQMKVVYGDNCVDISTV
jgi:hypothetical protein